MIRDEILVLASRKQGFRAVDIGATHTAKAVWKSAKQLVAEGLLHRVRISYKHVLHFTDLRHADAVRNSVRCTVIKPVRITTAKGPGWGPDDPMHITPETKITIADPPPRSWRTNTYSLLGG
jgi:hypothetical protein